MNFSKKPPACADCPAYEKGLGFVEASPRPGSRVTLVLDGPDEIAARFSTPVAWKSGVGKTLCRWLAAAKTGPVHITNVVRCYLPARYEGTAPKGKRAPTLAEASYCRRVHLQPTLKELRDGTETSHVLVTVGVDAARAVRGIEGSVEPNIGTFDTFADPRGPDS